MELSEITHKFYIDGDKKKFDICVNNLQKIISNSIFTFKEEFPTNGFTRKGVILRKDYQYTIDITNIVSRTVIKISGENANGKKHIKDKTTIYSDIEYIGDLLKTAFEGKPNPANRLEAYVKTH